MNLKEVKIIDNNFAHANYTTDFQVSQYIKWVRGIKPNEDELVFITDDSMPNSINIIADKIGLLMEPRAINPSIYIWIKENPHHFKRIFTYSKELLSVSDNIFFYPHCGCWIKPEDQLVYEKNKLVSIVASNKTQTIGHKFRHEAISIARNNSINLNVFGRGYKPIEYKLEALKDFAYSIVIENSQEDYYFTEKLIDSFVTGTIPIYWGCPSIGDFFNTDGMIIVKDSETLLTELKELSLEKYNSKLQAIHENFEKAKKYLIAEDWIYNNTNTFK